MRTRTEIEEDVSTAQVKTKYPETMSYALLDGCFEILLDIRDLLLKQEERAAAAEVNKNLNS